MEVMQRVKPLRYWAPPLASSLARGAYRLPYWRRLLDILFAFLGLLLLALLLPWLWLANRCWAPGPLFYRQMRLGLGGCAPWAPANNCWLIAAVAAHRWTW
ncbi:MAG: hypothetical protein DYG89_53850 [Caldilinea sp. CFX5]|nr:hypothetical protein [Caldilinea sp. CFX5]